MKPILNENKTKILVKLLLESEIMENPEINSIIMESLSTEDKVKHLYFQYGVKIKDGVLVEADNTKINKSLMNRMQETFMSAIKKAGSMAASFLKAVWGIIKKVWPLILFGGIAYTTIGGAKLFGLANNAKGIGDAFDKYRDIKDEKPDKNSGIFKRVISFSKSLFDFIYEMSRRFIDKTWEKKSPLAAKMKADAKMKAEAEAAKQKKTKKTAVKVITNLYSNLYKGWFSFIGKTFTGVDEKAAFNIYSKQISNIKNLFKKATNDYNLDKESKNDLIQVHKGAADYLVK